MLAMEGIRLVTLLGPGGIGKTRLALEIAIRMRRDPVSNVQFVSLEAVTDHTLLGIMIAQSLNVEIPHGRDPILHLAHVLTGKRALLVIDNLEHLPGAALTVAHLLTQTDGIKILTTSRSPLGVRGEHLYPLSPLEIAPPDRKPPLEELERIESIDLFVNRARMVDPAFSLTSQNAETIAAICAYFDGVPLAIELAAAQTAFFPPKSLLERIETFQPLLLPGPRDAPIRLQTLHNAISWSHDLLSDEGKALFHSLSVFNGSFSLDAAESLNRTLSASTNEPDTPDPDIIPALSELIGNSLLRQHEWQGEARFSMLRTIRHFAHDCLVESGHYSTARSAHARMYLELAERLQWAWLTGIGDDLERLEADHPNLLAALDWYHVTENTTGLARMAISLTGFWYSHTHEQLGTAWLRRALDNASEIPLAMHGRLHVCYGMLLGIEKDPSEAWDWLASGVSMLQEADDRALVPLALVWQGAIARYRGDNNMAVSILRKAIRLARHIEEPVLRAAVTARALSNLGVIATAQGDLEQATRRHEAALRIYRRYGPLPGFARALGDRGTIACDKGDFTAAMSWFRECLSLPNASKNQHLMVHILEWSAVVAIEWHQPSQATRLLGVAESLRQSLGESGKLTADFAVHPRLLAALQATEDSAQVRQNLEIGRAMSIDQAIAVILELSPRPTIDDAGETASINLTERERAVLRLLIAGYPNRDIARELFLSVRTVEGHVSHICGKLGVQTRTAAVSLAITSGLISPEASSGDDAARETR